MRALGNDFLKKYKIRRIFLITVVIITLGITGTYVGLRVWISSEANTFANKATKVFHKEKTEALIAVIESEDYSLKDKNNAIWALGVLKDKNALPRLESLVTGEECNHDSAICQYEIKKAISKIKGDWRGSWQTER